MIDEELKFILSDEGKKDMEGTLAAFHRLNEKATAQDLPKLVER